MNQCGWDVIASEQAVKDIHFEQVAKEIHLAIQALYRETPSRVVNLLTPGDSLYSLAAMLTMGRINRDTWLQAEPIWRNQIRKIYLGARRLP